MDTKSGFDILVENLTVLGYEPETGISNKTFIVPGSDRLLNMKFVACRLSEEIFFLAFDSYGTKAYSSSTFTGLYSMIELPEEAEYKITRKDWFDFIYWKRKKTGIRYIDDNLTIISSAFIPVGELSKDNVELFMSLNSGKNPYRLIVERDYCPRIELLKGKKIVAVETNNWIYKKEDLALLTECGTKLIRGMKSMAAGNMF